MFLNAASLLLLFSDRRGPLSESLPLCFLPFNYFSKNSILLLTDFLGLSVPFLPVSFFVVLALSFSWSWDFNLSFELFVSTLSDSLPAYFLVLVCCSKNAIRLLTTEFLLFLDFFFLLLITFFGFFLH